jgi:stearoyl-CoA desaturase (delta-9 desaturase)
VCRYQCPRWLEYFFAVCGTMTLEGGPMFWVGTHRVHHAKSDKDGNPHSPREGTWVFITAHAEEPTGKN